MTLQIQELLTFNFPTMISELSSNQTLRLNSCVLADWHRKYQRKEQQKEGQTNRGDRACCCWIEQFWMKRIRKKKNDSKTLLIWKALTNKGIQWELVLLFISLRWVTPDIQGIGITLHRLESTRGCVIPGQPSSLTIVKIQTTLTYC